MTPEYTSDATMTPEYTSDATMTPEYTSDEPISGAVRKLSRVVSAAMLMDDGLIVPGVRHFSPDMRAVLHRIYGAGYHLRVKEQGFINTRGEFMDRKAAWGRAALYHQILGEPGASPVPGTLFSEDLY